MKCCNCSKELPPDEIYICERCKAEIDRQADETMGNQEEEDGEATQTTL